MNELLGAAEIRLLAQNFGVVPTKKLGQNFVIDPNTIRKIVAVAKLKSNEKVVEIARTIKPSARGELEITSVNEEYLRNNSLNVTVLERGTAWLDTGTFESMNAAANFIQIVEARQGLKISCLEEVAWRNGWLSDDELLQRAEEYKSSPFSQYLKSLLN